MEISIYNFTLKLEELYAPGDLITHDISEFLNLTYKNAVKREAKKLISNFFPPDWEEGETKPTPDWNSLTPQQQRVIQEKLSSFSFVFSKNDPIRKFAEKQAGAELEMRAKTAGVVLSIQMKKKLVAEMLVKDSRYLEAAKRELDAPVKYDSSSWFNGDDA
jgi:hypothetical protein